MCDWIEAEIEEERTGGEGFLVHAKSDVTFASTLCKFGLWILTIYSVYLHWIYVFNYVNSVSAFVCFCALWFTLYACIHVCELKQNFTNCKFTQIVRCIICGECSKPEPTLLEHHKERAKIKHNCCNCDELPSKQIPLHSNTLWCSRSNTFATSRHGCQRFLNPYKTAISPIPLLLTDIVAIKRCLDEVHLDWFRRKSKFQRFECGEWSMQTIQIH